jgi:hypothetical protein
MQEVQKAQIDVFDHKASKLGEFMPIHIWLIDAEMVDEVPCGAQAIFALTAFSGWKSAGMPPPEEVAFRTNDPSLIRLLHSVFVAYQRRAAVTRFLKNPPLKSSIDTA